MIDLIDLISTLLNLLPISVLLAMLYGIQLLLYGIYQNIRTLLANFGFTYPIPDELSTGIGRMLTSTAQCCGVPFKYPLKRDNSISHLVCPRGGIELIQTAPDFYPSSPAADPTSFIENQPFDISAYKEYANAATPEENRRLISARKRIGNATEVAKWMITAACEGTSEDKVVAYANWNLDSDRGYGSKNWSGSLNSENKIVDETYED